MRSVPLPLGGRPDGDGGLRAISELGFGCAALLGRAGRAESLRALGAAVEAGITLFDTARSYGYGEGEALLGDFIASLPGGRQRVAICTKFGILPAASGGWKQRVKPLARAVVRAFPGLRKAAQRQAATEFTPGQFSVPVLRESLATSLRGLRTDYVDLLLLHAAPATALEQEDLLEALSRLVEDGTVRVAGISADLDVIEQTFHRRAQGELSVLQTAQFAMDPSRLGFVEATRGQQATPGEMLLVANHPFGGPAGAAATAHAVEQLRLRPDLTAELRDKLSGDPAALMPEVVLNAILRGTGISAVVPAMIRPANLERNVRAVEQCRFTNAELDLLRAALHAAATTAGPH